MVLAPPANLHAALNAVIVLMNSAVTGRVAAPRALTAAALTVTSAARRMSSAGQATRNALGDPGLRPASQHARRLQPLRLNHARPDGLIARELEALSLFHQRVSRTRDTPSIQAVPLILSSNSQEDWRTTWIWISVVWRGTRNRSSTFSQPLVPTKFSIRMSRRERDSASEIRNPTP